MNAQPNTETTSVEIPTSAITQRAMLVSLKIKQPTTNKQDKQATAEVNASHHAAQDAARVSKQLYQKDAIKGFKQAANEARQTFYDMTLPWGDGSRILLTNQYMRLIERMKLLEDRFWSEMETFLDGVDDSRESERRRLGSLYKEEDYQSSEVLRERFAFEIKFFPLTDASDWRVALGDAQKEELKRQTEANLRATLAEAAKEPWLRLKDVIDKMTEALSDPDKKFHATLIGNIEDLCDLLPALNINNDPVLTDFAAEVRKKLTSTDAKDLRQDKFQRKHVAEEAKLLSEKLDQYAGVL